MISISEAIEKVGSEKRYYRYVKNGLLPICREPGHHPFHLEIHFEILEQNLRKKFEKQKVPRFENGRRLTAKEKIIRSFAGV